MKKILFILVLFVCSGLSAQQYFFNGTVHVPKTTAEINAISSPVEGRQEANSDTGTIYYYNGSDWVDTGKPLVDASGFSGNLDSGITDLQLLAEAVDSLTISGSIADGSITEAKLSTSVNASLDLADSALQSGDNVSELVNDAGYITEGGNLIPVTQAEYDLLTPTEIQENDYAIVGEGDSSGGGATQLSDLSDVNTSTPTNRNVLVADGVDWESRALVESDISDLKQYLPLAGGTMTGNIDMSNNEIDNVSVLTVNNRIISGDGRIYMGVDEGTLGRRWATYKNVTSGALIFGYQQADATSAIAAPYSGLYSLDNTGVPTNSTDLITKAYGDANYAPTGDSGTTGLVLEGSTSGTYTMASQNWRWSRSGDIVVFTMGFIQVDGNTPVGQLSLDISGTSFPSMSSLDSMFQVEALGFPITFYSIQAIVSNPGLIKFTYQDALDNNNSTIASDLDFTGVGRIVVSGSYITND